MAQIEIPTLEDDGLLTPEVGDWGEDKYRLVKLYAELFTTSMSGKWEELVYVDLFAGAGRSRIRGKSRIIPASPLLALELKQTFNRYVFCEKDQERMAALQERLRRGYPGRDIRVVSGDVNKSVAAVVAELPRIQPGRWVLSFCFVDPYSLKNLQFETIAALADRYMDFLVLIPTGYDATRNEGIYLALDNPTIDRFLGNDQWRGDWHRASAEGQTFDRFMTDAFGESMKRLGYLYEGFSSTHLVESTEKRLRLYRLALFSRHKLGTKFWKEGRKYSTPQRSLDFG